MQDRVDRDSGTSCADTSVGLKALYDEDEIILLGEDGILINDSLNPSITLSMTAICHYSTKLTELLTILLRD